MEIRCFSKPDSPVRKASIAWYTTYRIVRYTRSLKAPCNEDESFGRIKGRKEKRNSAALRKVRLLISFCVTKNKQMRNKIQPNQATWKLQGNLYCLLLKVQVVEFIYARLSFRLLNISLDIFFGSRLSSFSELIHAIDCTRKSFSRQEEIYFWNIKFFSVLVDFARTDSSDAISGSNALTLIRFYIGFSSVVTLCSFGAWASEKV